MNVKNQAVNLRIKEVYEIKKGFNKQIELANYLKLAPSSISMLLNGSTNLSADRFFTLCNYLCVRPSYFIYEKQNDLSRDEVVDTARIFNNDEMRTVWKLIRKNKFPGHMGERITKNCLAEMFDVNILYIDYRDRYKKNPKRKPVKISLNDMILLCDIYQIPIDEVWTYLNMQNVQ